jgi:DNA-binding CsgD family transcriptional regulator
MTESAAESRKDRVAREMVRTIELYRRLATNPAMMADDKMLTRLTEVTIEAEERLGRFLTWTSEGKLSPATTAEPTASPFDTPVKQAAEAGFSDRSPLTRRHQDVAVLVARGLTNAEIARELVVEPGTVANHVAAILRRLDLRSRAQIAVWAVEHGLAATSADHSP